MSEKIKNNSCCALPFMHVQSEPDGKIKLCCLAKNTVKDSNGNPYNFGKDKIDTFFNSDYMKNIRKDMLNDVQVADCKGCYDEEAAGGISQRQVYTQEWIAKDPSIEETMLQAEHNDYYVEPKVKYFDFRFGNMCNLKCRSCGPVNSIQLLKESREIEHPEKNKFFLYNEHEIDNINDWYQTPMFFENFRAQEENIRQIYFTGGEPTIIEQNYELLQHLVDTGKASRVSLIFSTNMTNIQDRFVKLVEQFERVTFLASCEGFGDVHEYLRAPAKWNVFEKNITRLANMDPWKTVIMCTPVIQSVNLADITKFFEWIENINDTFGYSRVQILPIILTFPRHLDLEILPLEMKQRALAKLEDFVAKHPRLQDSIHFMGRMNVIRDKCNKDSFDPEALVKFRTYTFMLDEHRGQSLANVNPELYNLLQSL
jgi:pyruvate-formate lyase-activating enzyme